MKTISTTQARKDIARLITAVRETGRVVVIGRRNTPEAVLMKYPSAYSDVVDDITNVNAYSESFLFLETEPDLYTARDIKRRYA
jgi:prevent-host-death family protein